MKGYFITGTDTEIGKTHASVSLIHYLVKQGYRVAGLKPIASGCEIINGQLRNDDALKLMQSANVELSYSEVNRYAFEPAISPHMAARDRGVTIDPTLIRGDLEYALSQADICIVEGVGGWKAPLADSAEAGWLDVEKLALQLGLPVILVAGIRLGCINHTLLSIEKIQGSGANLVGWVANCCDPDTQRPEEQIDSIVARTSLPLLYTLPFDTTDTTDKPQGTWSLP